MKYILILILVFTTIVAKDRPKIALVLSGGGARGAAHAGVLKVLEEKNIPIDMIVGTSMGSFIGGLYASGKSPQEIEDMLVGTDWHKYVRTEFNRKDIPIRRKKFQHTYPGRLGLGINSKNEMVLPTGILKREPLLLKFLKETEHVDHINDFDKLDIPFRAVATNIRNGDMVVLKSGKLGEAIYASSAIPGGLQPIRLNGMDLVDGGVSSNLPIEVAREMGADIIIAVDVSEHFDEDLDVNSYFVVTAQLVNILMRKNADKSIETLTDKDVLLTPILDNYNGLDSDKHARIIKSGELVANNAYESKLKHLSLSNEQYALYLKKRKRNSEEPTVIIDEIRIANDTYISDDSIINRLHVKAGDKLDKDKIKEDMLHIYNMMIFDSVNYSVINEDGQNILEVKVTPSWDNHGEVRLSLGIEDNFKGNSNYSAKFGYTMFGLNEYGGEWKTDFETGNRIGLYSEIFQPLDSMQRYYVRPSILYEEVRHEEAVGSTFIDWDVKRKGYSFGLGADVGTDCEYEIGISQYRDKVDVDLFGYKVEYDSVPIYASFNYDSLDNLNFPNNGAKAYVRWEKEMDSMGGDYDHEQVYFDFTKPITFQKHNITAHFKYGNTYNNQTKDLPNANLIIDDKFLLGGLFNLSGYAQDTFIGNDMFLGVLKYRYKLKGGGFFGSINSPLYVGGSIEVGEAWLESESVNYGSAKKSASLYLAADTFLGPLYLAYARSDNDESTFYLYLGEKF